MSLDPAILARLAVGVGRDRVVLVAVGAFEVAQVHVAAVVVATPVIAPGRLVGQCDVHVRAVAGGEVLGHRENTRICQ